MDVVKALSRSWKQVYEKTNQRQGAVWTDALMQLFIHVFMYKHEKKKRKNTVAAA